MKIAISIPSRNSNGGVAKAQWTFAVALRVLNFKVRCLVPTKRWLDLLNRFIPGKLIDFIIDLRAPSQAKVLGSDLILCADWYSLLHSRKEAIPVFHGGYGLMLKYCPPSTVLGKLKTKLLFNLQKLAARKANFFISVSEESRAILSSPNGYICYNGVDLDSINVVTEKESDKAKVTLELNGIVVLLAGRFSAEKRLDFILNIEEKENVTYLVCIPDQAEASIFRSLSSGRSDVIVKCYPNGIPDMIWSCTDCVFMPSKYEGCPMIWIESIARGIPVVSTCVGHIPEIIEDNMDLEELVIYELEPQQVLDRLLLANGKRDYWRSRLRHIAERYHDINVIGKRLQSILDANGYTHD